MLFQFAATGTSSLCTSKKSSPRSEQNQNQNYVSTLHHTSLDYTEGTCGHAGLPQYWNVTAYTCTFRKTRDIIELALTYEF